MPSLCTECHYVGDGKRLSGNIAYETILWLLTFGFGFAGLFFFPFFWLPGLIFLILAVKYSADRYYKINVVCPECGHGTMIPAKTTRARQIISDNKIAVPKGDSSLLTKNIPFPLAVIILVGALYVVHLIFQRL